MALIGLSADAVEKYELEGDPDRGTDEATRFHIGTLSNRERSIIMDAASEFIAGENATAKIMPFQACYEATRKAVRGWDNFRDVGGNDIKYETVQERGVKVVKDSAMDRMHHSWIQEIGMRVLNMNEDSEEEAKTSAA